MVKAILPQKIDHLKRNKVLEVLSQLPDNRGNNAHVAATTPGPGKCGENASSDEPETTGNCNRSSSFTSSSHSQSHIKDKLLSPSPSRICTTTSSVKSLGVSPIILEALVEHYDFKVQDLVFVSELLRRNPDLNVRRAFENRIFEAHSLAVIGEDQHVAASGRSHNALASSGADAEDERVKENGRGSGEGEGISPATIPEHIRFAILEDSIVQVPLRDGANILEEVQLQDGYDGKECIRQNRMSFSADAIALAIIQYSSHGRSNHWLLGGKSESGAALSESCQRRTSFFSSPHGAAERPREQLLALDQVTPNLLPALLSVAVTKYSTSSNLLAADRELLFSRITEIILLIDHNIQGKNVKDNGEATTNSDTSLQEPSVETTALPLSPQALIVAVKAASSVLPAEDFSELFLEKWTTAVLENPKTKPKHVCRLAIALRDGMLDCGTVRRKIRVRHAAKNTTGQERTGLLQLDEERTRNEDHTTLATGRRHFYSCLERLNQNTSSDLSVHYLTAVSELPDVEDVLVALKFYADYFRYEVLAPLITENKAEDVEMRKFGFEASQVFSATKTAALSSSLPSTCYKAAHFGGSTDVPGKNSSVFTPTIRTRTRIIPIPPDVKAVLNAKLILIQETLKESWRKQLDLQNTCAKLGLELEEKILFDRTACNAIGLEHVGKDECLGSGPHDELLEEDDEEPVDEDNELEDEQVEDSDVVAADETTAADEKEFEVDDDADEDRSTARTADVSEDECAKVSGRADVKRHLQAKTSMRDMSSTPPAKRRDSLRRNPEVHEMVSGNSRNGDSSDSQTRPARIHPRNDIKYTGPPCDHGQRGIA
ncbi:unnamed protein product [Amoebophrya sp. A120]|nr:unnamed protein product [Amoebophrya sp. A120]|eukprot:GSA120T00016027001.1